MYYLTTYNNNGFTLSKFQWIFYANLVQLNASDGSRVRSVRVTDLENYTIFGDTTVNDEDSILFFATKNGSNSYGYLCLYYVK